MGAATLAFCYVTFAVLLVILNLGTLRVGAASYMHESVVARYNSEMPFTPADVPPKFMYNIETPPELLQWLGGVFKSVTFEEQQEKLASSGDLGLNETNDTVATVSSFNRILLIRMSAKRRLLQDNARGRFKASSSRTWQRYPKVVAGTSSTFSVSSENTGEDKSRICINDDSDGRCFDWKTEGSYSDAGGYVMFIDPSQGPEDYSEKLKEWVDVNMFDLRLGTFVVDMMVYNANVDFFMHMSWEFAFDYAGNGHRRQINRSFNLNMFNTSEQRYLLQYILRIVLLIFVLLFVVNELVKAWNVGLSTHWRLKASWVDAISLLLCVIVLLTYWILETNHLFDDFQFSQLSDPGTMAQTYSDLTLLGWSIDEQKTIIALNLFFVFVRAVSLVADLQTDLGIIDAVLDASVSFMLYFLAMFLLIMLGFVLLAYFIFGSAYSEMSGPRAFFTTFAMLAGKPVYQELEQVDEVLAPIFFYGFYIFFFLVMVNVFISILMSAYDVVNARIEGRPKEESPIVKLYEEIKHEFVDRAISWGRTAIGLIGRCPLVAAWGDILYCCLPSCPCPTRDCFSRCMEAFGGSDDPPERSSGKTQANSSTSYESVFMILFMVNFVVFSNLQQRGQVMWELSVATMIQPVERAQWKNPVRGNVEGLDQVHTFSHLRSWTENVVQGLYNDVVCADDSGGRTRLLYNVSCNNTKNNQQSVQVINHWNIGFQNNSFVRLTIQPACYVKHPDPRWRAAEPWLRISPDSCADTDCTTLLTEEPCHTPEGVRWDLYDHMNYTFSRPSSALGGYGLLGGYAISLGTTKEQVAVVLDQLAADGWFTSKAASMVFDWVTYNGNIDVFSYNKVSFSLQGTGQMEKLLYQQSFPLNIHQAGGFYYSERIWILVLFSIYIFGVLCYILEMARRIQLAKRGRSMSLFLWEFGTDWWNLSDLVSLGLSISSIVYFLIFVVLAFRQNYYFSLDGERRYQVPNDDVKEYGVPLSVDPRRYLQDNWYIFYQLERCQAIYSLFLTLAGTNTFLMSIKVVKYVSALSVMSVFKETLNSGLARNLYFVIIISLQLFGFALFYHVIFGSVDPSLGSPWMSVLTMFEWMLGQFDLNLIFNQDEFLGTLSFIAFIIGFRFIAVNMFLATMLTVYCDKVGANDVAVAKLKAMLREAKLINYPNKGSLMDDIKPDQLELRDGEVIVKELRAESKAHREGVEKGYILNKVNGDLKNWKEHCKSVQEIFEKGMPEEGEINLEFMERQTKQTSLCGICGIGHCVLERTGLTDQDEGRVTVKATCKNFWRMEGAITWIDRDVAQDQTEEQEDDAEDGGDEGAAEEENDEAVEGSDSDDAASARKASEAVRKAQRRLRVKKRLDLLLFSRWSDGKHRGYDGAVGTGPGWDSFGGSDDMSGQPKDIQYEVDREIFQLKEDLDKIPIRGQEAWLDCLVAAMEHEMRDDSVIADVLRTNEMQDMSMKNKPGREKKPLQEFYKNADEVVKMLEYKANKKYYQHLQIESEQRQEHLRRQNEVLHDYVCELEKEFVEVMELIHKNRAKKEVMLTKLAGLLDRTAYRHLDKGMAAKEDTHMQKLNHPWPDTQGDSAVRQPGGQAALGNTGNNNARPRALMGHD